MNDLDVTRRTSPAQAKKFQELHGESSPRDVVEDMLDKLSDEELDALNEHTLDLLQCADPIDLEEFIYEDDELPEVLEDELPTLVELDEELKLDRVHIDLDEVVA